MSVDYGLVEFELDLLAAIEGRRPPLPWGAAVGAALEALRGRKMIATDIDGGWRATETGIRALDAAGR